MKILEMTVGLLLKFLDKVVHDEFKRSELKREVMHFIEGRSDAAASSLVARRSFKDQVDALNRDRMLRSALMDVAEKEGRPAPNFATTVGRIAIVVGHDSKAQGAKAADGVTTEWVYWTEAAKKIQDELIKLGHMSRVFNRDGVGVVATYAKVREWEPNCCIELHFNAFDRSASGTETLYSDQKDHYNVREFALATMVQQEMCRALNRGGISRGLKKLAEGDGERGWANLNQAFAFPCILVEPFFGDNEADWKLGTLFREELCRGVARAVSDWLA